MAKSRKEIRAIKAKSHGMSRTFDSRNVTPQITKKDFPESKKNDPIFVKRAMKRIEEVKLKNRKDAKRLLVKEGFDFRNIRTALDNKFGKET